MEEKSNQKKNRGLLTQLERDVITGEADVTDNHRYQVRFTLRERIDELATDVELIMEHDQEFQERLEEAIEPMIER
jgi:hypothetical protein